jgi:type VI secretion system secreted protein VgrG
MADSLSQDQQQVKLTTPLGENTLALASFSAAEGLSELFEILVEAVSTQANLDFASTLGLGSTITLKTQDDKKRYFHGVMTEARWAGISEDLSRYQLVLRPWLWLLTRTSDCKIFSQKSPIDIIKQVFSDRGFSDFRDATTGSPPKLEYCVQYRETDFNFVCRLMEQFGIYYFFEHSDGKHTLVLADGKSSHQPAPGLSSVAYNPIDNAGRRETQYIETWSLGRRAQSGVFVLEDYGYKKPSANLLAQSQKPGGYAHDSMEMFDYPYSYVDTEGNDLVDQGVGEKFTKYRVEAAQSLDQRRSSTGGSPSLFPGALITLERHPATGENREYIVTQCAHHYYGQSYRSRSRAAAPGYAGNYEMTPSDRPFRAPRVSRKPEITGVQSALVIADKNNAGEEIDVDKLGRVFVRFYWDREKKYSRRVRVAQIWAGSNRGGLFTPRVGDEVLVAYEEGDPDRPIVVGSVYNGSNKVPLKLPDKKVKSGILTQSSKGGNGYNMLLFDDTAKSEVVKLRCQHDLMVKALNDETRVIGVDQSETIGGNVTKTVQGNETINIGSKGGQYSLTATKKITLTVGASSITMDPSSITIKSPTITIQATAACVIQGLPVKIN